MRGKDIFDRHELHIFTLSTFSELSIAGLVYKKAICYNNREGVILVGANTPGQITTQNLVISKLYQ